MYNTYGIAAEKAQRLKDEQNLIRREKIDARCRAALEKERRPPALQPFKIRIVPRWGRRQARNEPLTENELYLDDARPALILRPRLEHICILCHNAKSHPVLLTCGHSHCYVCIHMLLETQWACPECEKDVTGRSVPHDVEAAAIEHDNPGWDNSRVAYL
ncbi:hypothetical protein GGX14DRAFT_580984 [Mycena pura]|uniref:RING-type domain-containing protein n=1 Tax=Mycena pura TaxID=153505 RepID=A0AAD6URT0_9AGAR|nr:hypothetical protein GGX14DRAFT_580984 [Mycena pura]